MPSPNRRLETHFTRAINPSGRSRALCGHHTAVVTNNPADTTCLACLRCCASAAKRQSVPELVDSLIAEIKASQGADSVNRSSIVAALFNRIITSQLTEPGLISKLKTIDREISSRGY